MRKSTYIVVSLSAALGLILFGFQNCSQSVEFTSNEDPLFAASIDDKKNGENDESNNQSGNDANNDSDSESDEDIVCNPLNLDEKCDVASGNGLIGNLYYLTPSQEGLFDGGLWGARLDDYREFGSRVPVKVLMNSLNISPRAWDSGFQINNGEQVADSDGNKLFEWFHLDLKGHISLPAGRYQFASISDDGIRVTVGGEVIINNDRIHPPVWDCSEKVVSFSEGEKKSLRVEYFQGPRVQIALQVFVKRLDSDETSCAKDNFTVVDSSFLSK